MEDINKEELKRKKINIRLFPLYKAISWDLLFYYAIIFLYLLQVKKISAPQIFLADAVYNIAILICIIPSGKIVSRIGKRTSVIIANVCISIAILILLIMSNFYHLAIAYAIMAFGYSIKAIAENIILYDSLPSCNGRGKLFSIIDGKASSYYYYIDAISAVVTGFLYVLNPYIPIILCLIMSIVSTIISLGFQHTSTQKHTKKEKVNFKETLEHVKDSKRIQYLIIFYAIVSGLLYSLSSLRSSIFEDLKLESQYFGVIYAILQIVAGTAARFQDNIHNKFKNETLAVLSIPLTLACVFIGVLAKLPNDNFIFSLIIILFIIQGILKGAYRGLILRYMTNFTNSGIRTNLATVESLAYYVVSILFSLACSWLLDTTSTADTFIIVGAISTFVVGVVLYFMKGRVGLKPEQYTEEDLKYSHFNKEK